MAMIASTPEKSDRGNRAGRVLDFFREVDRPGPAVVGIDDRLQRKHERRGQREPAGGVITAAGMDASAPTRAPRRSA